jgi:formylglycine-generating enzyme required for sulfatase activity
MKATKGLALILFLLMLVIMLGGCPGRVIATYTLILNRNDNAWGGVSGGGTYTVDQVVRIEATPYQGYHFLNWTLEGTPISGEAIHDFTMPRENVTIVANFVVGEMVRVEGGTFQMGDEVGDLPSWAPSALPVHTVTLTYDYWIGTNEVTFAEYDAFCDATDRGKPDDEGWGRVTRPVINVWWWDAIAYCNWLSEQNGLPVAYKLLGEPNEGSLLDAEGNVTEDITRVVGYRLPTEAEWEYAASGGHEALPIPPRFLYAGSDDIDEVAWYRSNSAERSQPVGSKQANLLGLYDMSGNVREWCHDMYENYTSEPQINPIGPSTGYDRVVRGGCWNSGTLFSRVTFRLLSIPDFRYSYSGFRLSRTVIP